METKTTTGRLEHQVANQEKAARLLADMPKVVSDYYYTLAINTETTTQLTYIYKLRQFLIWCNHDMSSIDFSKICEADITRYLTGIRTYKDEHGDLHQTKFSTQKLNFVVLNNFCEYLVRSGILDHNPMQYMKPPKNYDHIERKKITEGDMSGMVKATKHGAGNSLARARQENWRERDTAIMMLFCNTGMRKTALTEINVGDINGDLLTVTDKRSKVHVYHLNEATKKALDRWLVKRKCLMRGHPDNRALFISNRRTRISDNAVDQIVKKYSGEVLGDGVSPHKLRGAYVTVLHDKTGDIEFVRSAVGHSSVATTQRYIADDGSSKIKASEIMEGIFAGC